MAKGIEAFRFDASNGLFALLGSGDFNRAESLLGLLPEKVSEAVKAATTKAGRWAEREGAKQLSKVSKLSIQQLRAGTRFKMKMIGKGADMRARIWFGLSDISVKWAGATQTALGVSSPVGQFPAAFISGKLGGHVFRRKGATKLPIEKVSYGVVGAAESVLSAVADAAATMFQTLLFEELDKLTGKGAGTSQAILGT